MRAIITLENADNALINTIKSIIKLNPQVKFKITKPKEPSNELLEAIKEVENGEVITFDNFNEFKKTMSKL